MILETTRLQLREYKKNDFEAYYDLKSDEETMFYLQDIQLYSREEAKKDFSKVLRDLKDPDRVFYFFHMEHKDTGEQLGSVGYTVMDDTPVGKIVHLGYFMYPKYWNQGFMTEAVKRVVRYAFEENDVYRITTGCFQENIGSEKVMIKCDFIKEAEHVDYEWHDGKMKTRVEYRLLKQEWSRNEI